MAHGREVINLTGLHFLDDACQVHAVGQVAVVQDQVTVIHMRVLIKVVDTVGVKKRSTAFDPVYDISFFDQVFGEISTVLSCYTCY